MRRIQFILLAGYAFGSAAVAAPLHERIDALILEKTEERPFAGPAGDAVFLRRTRLDFTGTIPAPAEVRAFLDDKTPGKRAKLIETHLAGEAFAVHWADRLSVMLLERQRLGKITEEEWSAYLETQLKGQPKWDALVRELIAASGKGEHRPAMKFLGTGDHKQMTENIARLMLGMDLECARCHDHPSVNEWKQSHYWGLFAYLNQTRAATAKSDQLVYLVEHPPAKPVEFQSVFKDEKETTGPRLPGGVEVAIPAFEKGQEFEKPAENGLPGVPKFRPRELLAKNLVEDPQFIRNSVNRIWFLMMGRGLVHPLDVMNSKNPPSHPELLDLLAEEFRKDYDLKGLLREIALSDTYQRSSRWPANRWTEGAKEVDPASYRVAVLKPLTPEQLLHGVLKATGNEKAVRAMKAKAGEKYDRKGYFTGTNTDLPPTYDEIRAVFVQTFGQPPGAAEVDFIPGLNKSLFLMNDKLILHWLQPRDENLVQRLSGLEPVNIAEELYLSVLSRFPDEEEHKEVTEYLERNKDRKNEALGELAWSLLCSTEFRLNH